MKILSTQLWMCQVNLKDNVKARLAMEELCARDELHISTRENDNP